MRRVVEGLGDAEGAMLRALHARADHGLPFLGCEVQALTPLGQRIIRVYDADTQTLQPVMG